LHREYLLTGEWNGPDDIEIASAPRDRGRLAVEGW
jgi:hypothetical protein